MHRRNLLGAAALAVGLTLVSVSSAFAAAGATLAPGSKAMTLSNSSTLANGLVQSTWQGSGITDTMTAPAGSTLNIRTVTINGHQAVEQPPQAAAASP
jgi:hypothetical protein